MSLLDVSVRNLSGFICRISNLPNFFDREIDIFVLKFLFKAKIEVDLNLDSMGIPQRKKAIKLSKFTEAYLKYSQAEHDESTYALNERFVGYFLAFIVDVPIDRIMRHNIEDYKILRVGKVSKSSVNMEIRHLKATFSFVVNVGKYLQENPFRGVKQYKIEGNNRAASLSESFNVHSLSHTFASHLVMNGTDLNAVQQLLGHSSIKVLRNMRILRPIILCLESLVYRISLVAKIDYKPYKCLLSKEKTCNWLSRSQGFDSP